MVQVLPPAAARPVPALLPGAVPAALLPHLRALLPEDLPPLRGDPVAAEVQTTIIFSSELTRGHIRLPIIASNRSYFRSINRADHPPRPVSAP